MLNILFLLIPSLLIITIATAYAILLKRSLVETFFISIATIILILFLSGLLNFEGCLLVGYALVLILSLFSLAFVIKRKKELNSINIEKGIGVFLLLLLLSIFINYKRVLVHFDEFTHWGLVVKNMYSFNTFGTYQDINIIFKSYPPASSLFQYFWIRPFNTFTEYPAYIGFNMLFFSLSAIFLRKFNLKNVLLWLSFLAIPLITGLNFYSTLLVDTMLGVLFGSTILFYYIYRKQDKVFTFILLSCITLVLSLMKHTGLALSILASLFIFINEFISEKKYLENLILKRKVSQKSILELMLLLSPIILPLLGNFIWKQHLLYTHTHSNWSISKSVLESGLLQYQKEALRKSFLALFNKPLLPIPLSFISVIFIFLFLSLLLIFLINMSKGRRKKLIYSITYLVIGGLLYACLIVLFYTFIQIPYHAVNLPSYNRYMFPYVIGIFIFFLYFIPIYIKQDTRIKKYLFTGIISLFYIFLLTNIAPFAYTYIFKARDRVKYTVDNRAKYIDMDQWQQYISKDDSVYIISQGDRGYNSLVLIYKLAPNNNFFKFDYSVSDKKPHLEEKFKDYPFTKIISPSQWSAYVLENYTFLYIHNLDSNFIDLYGKFFEVVEERILYRVTENENGQLSLVPVLSK